MTGAHLHEPVPCLRQIGEPAFHRFGDEPARIVDRECTDANPVAETEERGPVFLPEPLQSAGAGDDCGHSGLVLQQMTDVLGDLRTRDSRVDALLQLVELVQHEQDSSRARRVDRRREIELECLECVLSGKRLIQRRQERQLVRSSRITLRQAGGAMFLHLHRSAPSPWSGRGA